MNPKYALKILRQPDGITCGPTAIKMVAHSHGCGESVSIKAIGDMSGTNAQTGTTDVEMRKGLDGLGLQWIEHLPGSPDILRNALARGSAVLLRWWYGGMKHWVVAAGIHDDGTFDIFDPAQGRTRLTEATLELYGRKRNWQMFEVPIEQNPEQFLSIRPLKGNWFSAITVGENCFEHVAQRESIKYQLITASQELSPTLWIGERLVGVYFLERKNLFEPDTLRGVEGLGLALEADQRGRGYGSMMRRYPLRAGFDYVWGSQLRTLKNIDDWLKRRIIWAESGFGYVTVEPISNEAKEALPLALEEKKQRQILLRKARKRNKKPSTSKQSSFFEELIQMERDDEIQHQQNISAI